jgi:hypothetical protein
MRLVQSLLLGQLHNGCSCTYISCTHGIAHAYLLLPAPVCWFLVCFPDMIDEADSALKDKHSAAAGNVSGAASATAAVDARCAVTIDADVNTAVASDASIGQCRCCCTCNKASTKAEPAALPVPTAVATAAATATDPEIRAADSAAAPIVRSE